MADKLELSRADVAAVIDYIFAHARCSPTGRAYKVYEKMFDFQNDKGANKHASNNLRTGRNKAGDRPRS